MDLARKKVLLFRHCRTIESNTKFLLCNRRFPDQLNYLRQTNLELGRRIEALRRTIKEQQTQIKSMENKEENRDFFYVGREIFEGELGKLNSITGGRLKVEDIIQTARDIVRQPSKYPHVFLPIVDKILAIPNVEEYVYTTPSEQDVADTCGSVGFDHQEMNPEDQKPSPKFDP